MTPHVPTKTDKEMILVKYPQVSSNGQEAWSSWTDNFMAVGPTLRASSEQQNVEGFSAAKVYRVAKGTVRRDETVHTTDWILYIAFVK